MAADPGNAAVIDGLMGQLRAECGIAPRRAERQSLGTRPVCAKTALIECGVTEALHSSSHRYSYDRSWLTERMDNMARAQAAQAVRQGYVDTKP